VLRKMQAYVYCTAIVAVFEFRLAVVTITGTTPPRTPSF
jgi:hypothetical protein